MTVDPSKSLHINIADFLGYELAYKTLKTNLISKEYVMSLPGLSYTPEQFFWIASGQCYEK
jgi:hypothetical protein